MKKAAITALVLALLAPLGLLLAVAAIANPATSACIATQGLRVVGIPETLTVATPDGAEVLLDRTQLGHAATIITVGSRVLGTNRDAILVALMAALTESRLRNYANPVYPESLALPHDAVGADHDSLGLFQMRRATGWGAPADLMDTTFQVRAFMGGPTGPNYPSPRGLLDIPGWQEMSKGAAAQAVEVSAHPDRYSAWEPAAQQILAALTNGEPDGDPGAVPVPETGAVVFPLPAGSWLLTSSFGWRTHPIYGDRRFHSGIDLAAPTGTPILAVADGRVVFAGPMSGFGNAIIINHQVGGQRVSTVYGHMWASGLHVTAGDRVLAGQRIGDVGSAGLSSGPHLHLEIYPGGWPGNATDPTAWLNNHGASEDATPATGPTGCFL